MMSVLTPEGLNFAQAQIKLAQRGWKAISVAEAMKDFFAGKTDKERGSFMRLERNDVVILGDSAGEFVNAGIPVDMFVRPSSGNSYQAMLAADGKVQIASRANSREWYDSFTITARLARPFSSVSVTFPETLDDGVIKAVIKYHGASYASAIPDYRNHWNA